MKSPNWEILTDFPVERVFYYAWALGTLDLARFGGCGSLHIGMHNNSVVVGVYWLNRSVTII
jgi:hypothetical protein